MKGYTLLDRSDLRTTKFRLTHSGLNLRLISLLQDLLAECTYC